AVSRWTAERAQREPELKRLLECQSALDAKAQRLREREERLHEAEGEVAEIEGQISHLQARIAQDAALLAHRDVLRADLERLVAPRLLMEQLEADVRVLNEARQSHAVVQAGLEASRQKLLRELDRAETEGRRVEERDRKIADLDTRLADLAPKLIHFERA